MTTELPSKVIADLVEDPHDNGTYRLLIEGAELDRLHQSVDRAEKELAHWKAVARYNQATSLPESSTWTVVLAFARKMDEQLQKYTRRGTREDWKIRDIPSRTVILKNHASAMVGIAHGTPLVPEDHRDLAHRAVNLANYALMIADACGGLEEVK